jgi:hypothetical protein
MGSPLAAGDGLPPPAAASRDTPPPVTPPSPDGNPFAGAAFFVDPRYVSQVESSTRETLGTP